MGEAAIALRGTPVHVHQLRELSKKQVWKLRGRYEVTFDDNVTVLMAGRHIKLSWPYWGLSRVYPGVPTPSSLAYVYGEPSTDNKHLSLLGKVFVIGRTYGIPIPDLRYILSEHLYADAYNISVEKLLPYMTTIDIDTFMEIYDHPAMAMVRQWAEQYPTGYDAEGNDMVEKAYQLIEDDIFEDPKLKKTNGAVMSIHDKTIKGDSILQAYARGKMSEIDSRVYSTQVWEGFFTGLYSALNRLKESNAPSRSHLYNTDNIADAEYASRKFQLIANVLMNFEYGDCGTTHYHRHTFTGSDSSKTMYNTMVGMYYKFEGKDSEWLRFNKGEFGNVVDKPIIFRSAMTCKHLAKQSICSVCMGDLIYNMSEDTAPGHLASTSISERGSQGILSTKHLDFLRRVLQLIFTSDMSRFIERFPHLTMKAAKLRDKPLAGKWDEYELMITDKVHSELTQIAYYKNLKELDETALPDINTLSFARCDNEGKILSEDHIDIRMGVCGNFSLDFLKHYLLKKDELRFVGKSVYIPLTGWHANRPILVYTNRSESMAEFVSAFETKIRSAASNGDDEDDVKRTDGKIVSTVKNKKGQVKTISLVEMRGSTEEECTSALIDVHQYLERKLPGVPMTHIGILLAVTRVESPTNPFPAVGFDAQTYNEFDGKRFVDHNTIIGTRSLIPMFFFQGQQDYLDEVGCYVDRFRPASLYDGAFPTVPE